MADPKSWEQFVEQYNFILKFGADRLQQMLNAQAKAQGNTFRLTPDHVKELIPSIEKRLDKLLDQHLALVRRMHEDNQMPRGDNRPELTNQRLLGIEPGLVAKRVQQFEPVPWGDKFDKPGDTSFQDAYNQMIDAQADPNADPKAKDALVNQYKNKLKMDMSKRLEAKLRYEGPKLTPTIKPRGPGGIAT